MHYVVRGMELLWLNLEIMNWFVLPSSWRLIVVLHAVDIFGFPGCMYQFFSNVLLILKCTPKT